jgi:hypothetical protein
MRPLLLVCHFRTWRGMLRLMTKYTYTKRISRTTELITSTTRIHLVNEQFKFRTKLHYSIPPSLSDVDIQLDSGHIRAIIISSTSPMPPNQTYAFFLSGPTVPLNLLSLKTRVKYQSKILCGIQDHPNHTIQLILPSQICLCRPNHPSPRTT